MSNLRVNYQKQCGFSLLELMIALVIIGIVLAVGGTYLHNSRPVTNLNGAATRIWGELQNARMAAIRRNAPVIVRWSTDGVARISDASATANLITFVDLDRNNAYSASDSLVAEYEFPTGVTADSPGDATFRFSPKGYFEDLGGASSPWDFVISTEGDSDRETRGIRVFLPGTMRYFFKSAPQG